MKLTIVLANGHITCKRCQALSKRTKQQCARPAMKGKRVCNIHGGKSTGPKSVAGKARIAKANTVFGTETRRMRKERSKLLQTLAQLEDIMHILGLTSASRTVGPKPTGYHKLLTVTDAHNWLHNNI